MKITAVLAAMLGPRTSCGCGWATRSWSAELALHRRGLHQFSHYAPRPVARSVDVRESRPQVPAQ